MSPCHGGIELHSYRCTILLRNLLHKEKLLEIYELSIISLSDEMVCHIPKEVSDIIVLSQI